MSNDATIELMPNPLGTSGFGANPPPAKRHFRRLWVFLSLLSLSLGPSLVYLWQRVPIFESKASLLTVVAGESAAVGGASSISTVRELGQKGQSSGLVLTETNSPAATGGPEHAAMQRQILLGVPVFEETLKRLEAEPETAQWASQKPGELHRLLDVGMINGTNLVELKATGPQAKILAPLVNAWVDAYQALREQNTQEAESNNRTELEERAVNLEAKISAKRLALQRFRAAHDILSSSDDSQNQPVAKLRGLNDSANRAVEEQVKAKSKLDAIRAAIANGKPVVPTEEAPILTNLEQQLLKMLEDQKSLQRRYTPAYLAMHPQLKLIPGQIEQVKAAIREKLDYGSRAVLSQAEQDYAAAEQALSSIRQQIEAMKRESTEYNARFAEQGAMQADLDRLEDMNRDIQAKLARIETKPKQSYPPLQIVERAYPPTEPISPDYWRDSGIALAASLAFALAGVWLYDYLTRIEEAPATAPMPSFQFYSMQGGLPSPSPEEAMPLLARGQAESLALESPMPRELTTHELRILLDAADVETQTWIGLLLSGLAVQEAVDLRLEQVDLAGEQLRLDGDRPRTIPLAPALKASLAGNWFTDSGVPAGESDPEEVAARIHCAAVDAGLSDPESIDPSALRHSYLAYLVRQGIRLSELERVVGRLPAKNLKELGRYSPQGPGLPADKVPLVHPVLQG